MPAILFEYSWGYKRSHVVDWIFKKHGGNAVADSRGSHAPKHKMSVRTEKAILEHIESFHPAVSHYRRKHAPLRRYLPPTLNVRKRHDLFTESLTTEKVSYPIYRKVFKAQNIGFTKLGEEECEDCEVFKQHKCQKKTTQVENKDDDRGKKKRKNVDRKCGAM